MISQSCEIDHSECHCGGGRHMVSHICQARSPDKNLGATDPRAPVSRECWAHTQVTTKAQRTQYRYYSIVQLDSYCITELIFPLNILLLMVDGRCFPEFAPILIKISSLNLIQFWHPLCYFYLTLGLFVLI